MSRRLNREAVPLHKPGAIPGTDDLPCSPRPHRLTPPPHLGRNVKGLVWVLPMLGRMTYVATPIAVAVGAGRFTFFLVGDLLVRPMNDIRSGVSIVRFDSFSQGLGGICLVLLLVSLPVHLGAWPGVPGCRGGLRPGVFVAWLLLLCESP